MARPAALALALSAIWIATPIADAGAGELRAGAAVAAIELPAGPPLAGYGARGPGNVARNPAAPVEARALVLADAGVRIGIVVLDVLIVTPDLRRAIREAGSDLDLSELVVAATHTHSGPGGYLDDTLAELAILGWYRAEVREALVAAAAEALGEATARMQPARLASASADGGELARNRRRVGGPQDPRIPILLVDGPDAPLATLFALAAHPTVLSDANLRVDPDYPGSARMRVEARRGGVALFLAGPLGDQKPFLAGEPEWPADVERQRSNARRLGEALGDRVENAAGRAKPAPALLAAVSREWELPPVDVRASCVGWVGGPLLHVAARRFLPDRTRLVALRLGDLRLLASPFELGVEVAAAVRQGSRPGGPILIAAHANDWLGYLLTPEDWDRGSYEPCLAFHGRDLAPLYVDEATRALNALP